MIQKMTEKPPIHQMHTPLLEVWKQRREIRERQKTSKEICHWMDNYVLPFLEGIAKNFNEPLIPGVKRLILEKKNPFRPTKDWNRTKETQIVIGTFLKNPVTATLWRIAKPLFKGRIDHILNESDWVINTVLQEEYPDFYSVIVETEGGVEWFKTFLQDLTQTLKPLAK